MCNPWSFLYLSSSFPAMIPDEVFPDDVPEGFKVTETFMNKYWHSKIVYYRLVMTKISNSIFLSIQVDILIAPMVLCIWHHHLLLLWLEALIVSIGKRKWDNILVLSSPDKFDLISPLPYYQMKSSKVEARQVEACQVVARQVEAHQVEASRDKTKARQVESNLRKSSRNKARKVEASWRQVKSRQGTSSRGKPRHVEARQVQSRHQIFRKRQRSLYIIRSFEEDDDPFIASFESLQEEEDPPIGNGSFREKEDPYITFFGSFGEE